MVLTGPNMGGKSTFIRQVALITVLAQTGSYVPADLCRLELVDSLFSRVGASDDIRRGKSTFMLEMEETSAILDMATSKSLVTTFNPLTHLPLLSFPPPFPPNLPTNLTSSSILSLFNYFF